MQASTSALRTAAAARLRAVVAEYAKALGFSGSCRLRMVGDNALERAPLRGQLPPAYGQPCSTSCSSALSMTTITDLQAVNQPTTATRLQATNLQAKPA